MNDDNIHTGICIVLPAAHYGSNALSHCTLAFLGNTDQVDYPKDRAERLMRHLREHWATKVKTFATQDAPLTTWVDHMDMFGVERDTLVACLVKGEKLMGLRERTTDLLDGYDIPYSKMFEYTPHVSLTPQDHVPNLGPGQRVQLYPPVLWWGDDRPKDLNPIYVGTAL